MRVVIYDPPGAEKTTLVLSLGRRFGWPVHHLDAIFFDPGGAPRDRGAGAAEVERLARDPHWIIEGNHGAALEFAALRADRVVVLQLGPWAGLWRLLRHRVRPTPLLADKGPGGGRQVLPLHLVRCTLFVHPRLEPHHMAKIEASTSGEVRVFEHPRPAAAWFDWSDPSGRPSTARMARRPARRSSVPSRPIPRRRVRGSAAIKRLHGGDHDDAVGHVTHQGDPGDPREVQEERQSGDQGDPADGEDP
ncbi:MAG: hypothetical protein AAF264_07795 [Pseudomonadota bacterium]